jgi:UDP-N-acetylglucosamine enolpyruvyl transferase
VEKILVRGGPDFRLKGKVRMSGAKNAALPAIAAGLLTAGEIRLRNVPRVKDVRTILTLIRELGGTSSLDGHSISVRVEGISSDEASYELVRAMRASVRSSRASARRPSPCREGAPSAPAPSTSISAVFRSSGPRSRSNTATSRPRPTG